MTKSFSLKDQLFNRNKVQYLAGLIKQAHSPFREQEFVERVVGKFPELELKQRIVWIRENLKKFLPDNYYDAVQIILEALPPECDPGKTDDDFGDFIFAPLGDFIAAYGCNHQDINFSLNALKEITKRFSAEDAVRYFINAFPKETLSKMQSWSQDNNYHVRRLSSEGTRPRLPWCQKVELNHVQVIKQILDNLYHDPTRYVVRSVANHLNDIAKENPELVITTLVRWKKEGKQKPHEIDYLISHALRTLIKDGNQDALELLGYRISPKITVNDFVIHTEKVKIGDALKFSFTIHSQQHSQSEEKLMIDYTLHFQGKNGDLRPKVFKIKKCTLAADKNLTIDKKHPLRIITTRKLYPGKHKVTLKINGKSFGEREFLLED